MPTENPKISLYVPQAIYDRFIEYKEKSGLSMSQAGTVLLAEYFGLEETIKEITEGTTVGGVTLNRVKKIEELLLDVIKRIELLENSSKSYSSLQHELPIELSDNKIQLTSGQLAKRLRQDSSRSITNRSRISSQQFADWSSSQDPDDIAWEMIRVNDKPYYVPSNISDELLSRLQDWIKRNPH